MKKLKYFFHKKGIILEGSITAESISEIISCYSYSWSDLTDNKADTQLIELKKTIKLLIYATTGYEPKINNSKNQFDIEPFIIDLKNIKVIDSIGLIAVQILLTWLNDELNIKTVITCIPDNMNRIIKLYNKSEFFSKYTLNNNLLFK